MSSLAPSHAMAGPLINDRIAVAVMGWTKAQHGGGGKYDKTLIYMPGVNGAYTVGWHWKPSEDIGQAWLVVERMSTLCFHARIKSPFSPDQPYFAGFTPHGSTGWNGLPDFSADADSAPLAIRLAALKALDNSHDLPPSLSRDTV